MEATFFSPTYNCGLLQSCINSNWQYFGEGLSRNVYFIVELLNKSNNFFLSSNYFFQYSSVAFYILCSPDTLKGEITVPILSWNIEGKGIILLLKFVAHLSVLLTSCSDNIFDLEWIDFGSFQYWGSTIIYSLLLMTIRCQIFAKSFQKKWWHCKTSIYFISEKASMWSSTKFKEANSWTMLFCFV